MVISFPIHTRNIATLQYELHTNVLWAVYRSGEIRSIGRIGHSAVMDIICRLPLLTSVFIRHCDR